jgi:hypothetical protein
LGTFEKSFLFFYQPFSLHTGVMPFSFTPFENNPLYIGVLFGLFFSFYIWSVLDFLSKTSRRQRGLQALSVEMGFQFFRSKWELERSGLKLPGLIQPHRPRKTLLGMGQAWDGLNILKGTREGRTAFYLERHYQERELRIVRETLALYGQTGGDLPYFELVPLRLFDKFHRRLELEFSEKFSGFKMSRIEMDGLGEFRRPRHYLWGLTGQENRYQTLFTREFLEFLIQFPNWRLKGKAEWIMAFEENFLVPVEKMPEFAAQVSRAASFLFSGPNQPAVTRPIPAIQPAVSSGIVQNSTG